MPDETVADPLPESSPPPETPRKTAAAEEVAPAGEDWATRFKYLLADFENYRRRAERERESASRQARGAMVRELLPIIEAFRSAREAGATLPTDSPLRRGLDLLDREWMTFLKHEGVEPVAVPGGPFAPSEEEAVGDAPATKEHPDGTIVEVVQQGYRFFGGLLRPAKVVVARANLPSDETTLEEHA